MINVASIDNTQVHISTYIYLFQFQMRNSHDFLSLLSNATLYSIWDTNPLPAIHVKLLNERQFYIIFQKINQ